jgi:hypothetical protein
LLAHGRWFSPGTLASSTTKTGRHNIAEILLKMALNTINQIKSNQVLTSAQANPSPLYPVLHLQVKLPSVLSQAAFVSQGLDAHSSISEKKIL